MSNNLSSELIVLDKIKIPKDRKCDERVVKQLMESIKKIGLLEPVILCRPARSMGVHLVAGRNRVEAFKRLKIKSIPARVEEGDTPEVQQWRELAEIDENLIRREMTSAQRAKLLTARKLVYEALNPETKDGQQRSKARKDTRGRGTPTFAEDTAKKLGASERTVRQYTGAGRLGAQTLDKVTGTSLDNVHDLNALARMDEDEREEIIARAARGEDVTARAPEPTPGYAKLIAAWHAASHAGRKAFMAEVGLKSTLAMD